jgi:uncharacterized protein YjbI with pentapeptide repeats
MAITDLEIQIDGGRSEFIGETIQILGNGTFITGNTLLFVQNLRFDDCIFTGTYLEFEDITTNDFYLGFFNCTFHISIAIKDCHFNRLGFRDNNSSKYTDINGGHYKNFFFRNNSLKEKKENILTGNISIGNLIIDERIELDYLNHRNGEFDFYNNILSNLNVANNHKIITFENSSFENINLTQNKFEIEASFEDMEIIQKCEIEECEFQKVNFSNMVLGSINFIDCKFHRTSSFHYIYGNLTSSIKFKNCLFDKYVQFNGTTSYKFEVDNVQFNNVVSFQEAYFDIITIDRSIFEKRALFDDIQIKKIDKCNRRTIRIIKQELQKAENKIDYNRFRVYEFNAYREDIKKKLKEFENDKDHLNHRVREPIQLRRDGFILRISDVVSEYGTDWKRAFNFTILTGSIIYILFFICENYDHEITLCDWDNWKRFISGIFRFFLVTDFYNPLETERVYLSNPFSWLIFIFGKIVIAFGIYEMIQSFRKFKA